MYSKVIVIGQPETLVVDFIPETGIFVSDVKNKVYFHAFTNDARSDVVDFKGSSLVRISQKDNSEEIIND